MLDATVQRRISILVYADLEAAYEFPGPGVRARPGRADPRRRRQVVHGELQAGDGVVWLHPEVAGVRTGVAADAGRLDRERRR